MARCEPTTVSLSLLLGNVPMYFQREHFRDVRASIFACALAQRCPNAGRDDSLSDRPPSKGCVPVVPIYVCLNSDRLQGHLASIEESCCQFTILRCKN